MAAPCLEVWCVELLYVYGLSERRGVTARPQTCRKRCDGAGIRLLTAQPRSTPTHQCGPRRIRAPAAAHGCARPTAAVCVGAEFRLRTAQPRSTPTHRCAPHRISDPAEAHGCAITTAAVCVESQAEPLTS